MVNVRGGVKLQMVLEQTLKTLGTNILEFFSTIICGGVVLLVALAVIGCCVAWRGDE